VDWKCFNAMLQNLYEGMAEIIKHLPQLREWHFWDWELMECFKLHCSFVWLLFKFNATFTRYYPWYHLFTSKLYFHVLIKLEWNIFFPAKNRLWQAFSVLLKKYFIVPFWHILPKRKKLMAHTHTHTHWKNLWDEVVV
jgi:hypothetical protein